MPTHTLPGWLQAFVNVNPVSHLVSAVRELANHGLVAQDFWWTLFGALVIVAVFAPLPMRAYMRQA